MSGGSLWYVYSKVEYATEEIRDRSRDPLHIAFAAHLNKVAKALHDLEWLFSSDYGPGDEVASINACLQPGAVLAAVVSEAKDVLARLETELANSERKK